VSVLEQVGRKFARFTTNQVVRRPWAWRLLRRLTRMQFNRIAPVWDQMRTPEAFASLEAALDSIETPPKRALDLGTGTGRLAIGVALMSQANIVGVDIDARALELARENAKTAGVKVEWIQSTIDDVDGTYETVIMNPPYGTRTIHADTQFLDKAFQLAPVTYSIHKASTRTFLARYVHKSNRRIAEARTMSMKIPHLYSFHTRRWKSIEVDLCRIVT